MRSTVDQVDQDEVGPAPDPTGAGGTVPLSQALREATAPQHTRAERTTFLEAMLAGSLDVSAYADLAVQHHTVLQRTYGLADAVQFYPFPAIPKLKPYKDAYRSRLDGLAFCADERAEALREACEAFDLTTGLVLELGAAHPVAS